MASLIFVTWLTLIEYVIAITSQSFSLYVFGGITVYRILKRKATITEISASMHLYILMQILTSLVTLCYLIYLLLGWRVTVTSYNAYWMFFTGAAQTSFLTMTPVAILALGLDRCFSLLYPLRYKHGSYVVVSAIIGMTGLIVFSLIFRIIPAYPITAITSCVSFGCLTSPEGGELYTYIRYGTSTLILMTSGFLLYLVRYKLRLHLAKDNAKKVNKLVLSTLTTTFVLDFLPHLSAAVFNTITGVNIITYLGPYSTVISSIESGLCAVLYRKVFKFGGLGTVQITATSNAPQKSIK